MAVRELERMWRAVESASMRRLTRILAAAGLLLALAALLFAPAQVQAKAQNKVQTKAQNKAPNKIQAKAQRKKALAMPVRKGGMAKRISPNTAARVPHGSGTNAKRGALYKPKRGDAVRTKFVRGRNGKLMRVALLPAAPPAPPRLSFGQLAGLRSTDDPLELQSSVALVVDEETKQIVFSKNESAVLPIASLTKLMTGLVIAESRLPMSEVVEITDADVDTEKGSGSRLAVGTALTRGELMHLALMSSENRAAHALGRSYPGGVRVFVAAMNERARSLGLRETTFVEPTGLSSRNQSSARDLATLAAAAAAHPQLREWSTSPGSEVAVGNRTIRYNNTNPLVLKPGWEIGLQKTGYISEAGRCLVMMARLAGRNMILVFLDSTGKYSRLGDAERVRRWLEGAATGSAAQPDASLSVVPRRG